MLNMEINVERRGGKPIRSGVSWPRAFAWSALLTAILFAFLNWHGCWLFMYGAEGLVVFAYPFTWLLIFFVLRTRWRFVLAALTLLAAPAFSTRFGMVEQFAGFESTAVTALQQLQSKLEAYRSENRKEEYPETLPTVKLTDRARKYYRFAYVPSRSADGKVLHYVIQATPARRDCEFHRSFTIAEDGKVYWTLEPRAATLSDMLVFQ
jgi:Tfp pilus assembly protein PilE